MSFHLCVYHTAKPVTDALASERYVAYCDEDDLTPYLEPSPSVAAFLKELSAAYPDLDDIAPEDEDARAGSPWASGHDVSEGHVHMAMTFSSAGSITDDVTSLARKHELVCYCPQSGTILTAPERLLSDKDHRRQRKDASREAKRAHRAKQRGPTLRDVAAVVEREMAELGFQHEGNGTFSKALTDDIDGCIALSVAEGLDYSRIEVITGLRHKALSAVDRRLSGAHHDLPDQPLIGIPLFVLHRRQRRWRRASRPEGTVSSDEELQRWVETTIALLSSEGLSFMSEWASLELIAAALLAGKLRSGTSILAPAAALCLLGRQDEAAAFVDAWLLWEASQHGRPERGTLKQARRLLLINDRSNGEISAELRSRVVRHLRMPPSERYEDPHWERDEPFVAMLDALLSPMGFARDGRAWYRAGSHSVQWLDLEPSLQPRLWISFDTSVRGAVDEPGAEAATLPFEQRFLTRPTIQLRDLCNDAMRRKVDRALTFHYDRASFVEPDLNGRPVDMRRYNGAEEPATLTAEWRIAAVREAMITYGIPMLSGLEQNALTRMRYRLKVVWNGHDLSESA